MELITSPKSVYLLDAGLDVLHAQSNEWLSDIAFWHHEVAFFYSFMTTKSLKSVPIHLKNNFENTETELRNIIGGGLNKLQSEVKAHENYLSRLMDNKANDQESYRKKHRELTILVDQFENSFKKVKKEIFSLVELAKKETN